MKLSNKTLCRVKSRNSHLFRTIAFCTSERVSTKIPHTQMCYKSSFHLYLAHKSVNMFVNSQPCWDSNTKETTFLKTLPLAFQGIQSPSISVTQFTSSLSWEKTICRNVLHLLWWWSISLLTISVVSRALPMTLHLLGSYK